MNPIKFWLTWMKVVVWTILGIGLVCIFFPHSNILVIFTGPLRKAFLQDIPMSVSLTGLLGYFMSSIGVFVVAWSIVMLYLIHYPLKRLELWAWKALFYSVSFWFVVSSVIYLYYQIVSILLFNVVVMLQAIAPLLLLRKAIVNIRK
jgi:hypothetical protein